jgi:hypothetical protein
MSRRPRIWVCLVPAVLLLLPLVGCSRGDDPADDAAGKEAKAEEAVAGSFVGAVSGTQAFVAVIASPAAGKKDSRAVQVYVSDGRRLSESFSGSISDNGFVAKSDDGEAEAKGNLSGESVTGTVELPGGKTARYEAKAPSGAAGLYDLTVAPGGDLSGASAAGLGVTGEIALRERGTGMLRLVDGKRLRFRIARSSATDVIPLRAGEVRLIVVPGGRLLGAGKARPAAGAGISDFFIRSA